MTVFGGDASGDILRLARLLSGAELIAEGQAAPVAWLSRSEYRQGAPPLH